MSKNQEDKMEEEIQDKQKQQPPKKGKKKKEEEIVNELSEEDQKLKDDIDGHVAKILGSEEAAAKSSLEALRDIVQSATSTMTSVPKPFKFLNTHYKSMVSHYENIQPSYFKKILADFLSVLSMTFGEQGKQLSLQFLKEGTQKNFKKWGFGYVQHLTGDISEEYEKRLQNEQGVDDLYELVASIVPFFMENNAEHDAIDLLMEVDKPESLIDFVTEENLIRVLDYMKASSLYCSHGDEQENILQTGYNLAMKFKKYNAALKIAIKLDQHEMIVRCFEECQDKQVKQQMAFLIARQRVYIEDLEDDLQPIACNTYLSQYYLKLGKDLSLLKPKTPEDVYKSHLVQQYGAATDNMESLKDNLADTYVNAFVNCGLQNDALMVQTEDDIEKNQRQDWHTRVKGHALTSAIASIGMVTMWDPSNGTDQLNPFMNTKDGYIKEGACIGIGILNQGMPSDEDMAQALLGEQIEENEIHGKRGAIIGLGIAYAGSSKESLQDQLVPILADTGDVELGAYAALSLGLIYVGTCDDVIGMNIWEVLNDLCSRPESLSSTVTRFYAVGLSLLYLAQQEKCEGMIDMLQGLEYEPIRRYCEVCIEACAYVGSGNVLKIQKMLQVVTEQKKKPDEDKMEEENAQQQNNQQNKDKEENKEKKDSREYEYQQVAILGIALIASSEEIGNGMAMRTFQHILQFCDIEIKRAIPIGLGILNISNPKIQVMDTLVKLSHDDDEQLSLNAILALGMIGAGTNNSRLSDILRGESGLYKKGDDGQFLIKIAQGLLHLGKGMLTLQPYYSDKFLLSKVQMAGIVIFANSCLDIKNIILDKYHYNLFYLCISMYPKFLFTLDENLENFKTSVKVGQAIDYVGTSGNAKKITGFQTHNTPVIVNYGERAELDTQEFLPIEEIVLENFVIVKKNENYVPDEDQQKKNRKKTVNL